MNIPYIWIGNLSSKNVNILHNKKNNFNYTLLVPKQIIKMNLEIIDQMSLMWMEQQGLVSYNLIPAEKKKIKYTSFTRFEIMDI